MPNINLLSSLGVPKVLGTLPTGRSILFTGFLDFFRRYAAAPGPFETALLQLRCSCFVVVFTVDAQIKVMGGFTLFTNGTNNFCIQVSGNFCSALCIPS